MPSLLSLLRFFSPKKRREAKRWKEIEASAAQLQSLRSWTSSTENTLLFQAFEWHVPADGAHWTRLRHALPGLKAIGIDQIWLPPGCKGMDRDGNGYDIYDLYDLGEFEQKGSVRTKFGSREELQDLVEEAQGLGVRVIWDAVLNHKAGADRVERCMAVKVDENRRDKEISAPSEIDAWVGFDFEGRGDQYSTVKYNQSHFSGVDWDQSAQENAIYRLIGPRKGWASDVSREKGNYDYLMFANLDLSHPEVRQDLFNWGAWITKEFSLGGMRLDAAKHMSVAFQKAFAAHVRETTGKPDLFFIGEYWTENLRELMKYLEDVQYTLAAYDVPLVNNFSRISRSRAADLRKIFDGTLVRHKPESAVTIVTNHDTQPGQMMDTPIAPSCKPLAYALTLLRKEGNPSLFYGDLYGINSRTSNGKPAIPGTPKRPSFSDKLPILTRARKHFAYGEQQDYFDKPNCIGFVRYGNARHPSGLACVLSNAGAATKRMYVGPGHANETWTDILRPQGQTQKQKVTIDARGYGEFPVEACSVSVWVEQSAAARFELRFEEKLCVSPSLP
ncbi:glycoside hydrolase superfamily [Aspergillus pseudodeflectus]|uniref:Glycoside hydrolase superfamily n=1 Tax=Aspergillus pseudodeflectus TaxID=176178 RepID=A0ABR4KWY2_9EURO